jgi:predicted glycosyl hydrolase (DUF1957 family)
MSVLKIIYKRIHTSLLLIFQTKKNQLKKKLIMTIKIKKERNKKQKKSRLIMNYYKSFKQKRQLFEQYGPNKFLILIFFLLTVLN